MKGRRRLMREIRVRGPMRVLSFSRGILELRKKTIIAGTKKMA
jgi:hypothetical protein